MRHKDITRTSVLLNPRCGGNDTGLVGEVGELVLMEKDVNLAFCYVLAGHLAFNGIDVQMTRYDDSKLTYKKRVEIANDLLPNLVVSLGMSKGKWGRPAIQTYDFSPNSELVAEFLRMGIDEWGFSDHPINVRREREGMVGKTISACVRISLGNIAMLPEHLEKFSDMNFINEYASILANSLLESFKRVAWNSKELSPALYSGL